MSPILESLESRTVPTIFFENGLLTITGDEGFSSAEISYFDEDSIIVFQGEQVEIIDLVDLNSIVFYSDGEDQFINSTNLSVVAVLNGADNIYIGGSGTLDAVFDHALNSYIEGAEYIYYPE